MKVIEIINHDNFELVNQLTDSSKTFSGCYVGDLLSWVMSHAKVGQMWLTVQAHPNIIAIATLLELGGVIVVEGAEIPEETIKRAEAEGVVLLKTSLSAVEVIHYLEELQVR
ncbi:MAG: hypothetical protein ACRCST_16450 [Turicibacter sp.]